MTIFIDFILSRFGYVKLNPKPIIQLSLEAESAMEKLLFIWKHLNVVVDLGEGLSNPVSRELCKDHLKLLPKFIDAQKKITEFMYSYQSLLPSKIQKGDS